MTAQEIIKKMTGALESQNYTSGNFALDEAVRKSSRFNGIEDAISHFLEDQKEVERDAIKTILGTENYKTEYDGKQLSDLLTMAETDTALAAVLDAKDYYPYNSEAYGSNTFTAAERIRMLTANKFLADYCGITLEKYYFHTTSGGVTYYSNFTTGNFDTGAITGSDAGGSSTEKTAENVMPEIGNKYTATASTSQIIHTGSNDWLVTATDANDTIYSGGTDSIDAAAGADVIYVTGNDSTVKTGSNDNFADTVNLSSDVKTVTIVDLESVDTLNIEGTFTAASANLNSDTDVLTVTDSAGKRTFFINGWTAAQEANVSVNGSTQKLGEWLGNFVAYTPNSDTVIANSSNSSVNPISVNLEDVSGTSGSFSLLTTARTATFQDSLASGDVGNVTSEFPLVTSFKTHGLTVELWGAATDSEASTVSPLTLDTMSAAQKNIFAGLYKWWVKEALKLNEDSFDFSFNSPVAKNSNIKVFFYTDTSSTLAFVRNSGNGKDLQLGINMSHYSNISSTDFNGSGSSLLDRTIAHEFTHAIMAASVHNFNNLPQFFNEGIAELVHGIDDERGHRIWELAGAGSDSSKLSAALSLTDTSTANNDSYAAGYMFLRYFANKAASDTSNAIALGDAKVSVNLSGDNETYYANLTSSSNIERAVTTSTSSNFSVGSAKDRSYSLAAGITQQIFTTDEDWTIRDIGSNNTLVAGAGKDYVTLTGSNNFVSLQGGDNRVSLAGGYNNITTADGADSIRVTGSNNSILTGAGNDSVTFAAYSGSSINPSNYLDTGDGEDYISIYNDYQTISSGADVDTIHIRGNYNSVDGGAGNDDISIYTAYNTITGGEGTDRYVMQASKIDSVTITDFSIEDKEYIYLTSGINSAYYDSVNDAVVLGNINVYLANADNINDFLGMSIYNSTTMTKLEDLMGAKVFDWSKDGDYYFMIENDAVNIADDVLAYDGTKLQQNKKYSKVTLKGNAITITSDAEAQITITPPATTANNYFLTLENNNFTFSGEAVFEGSNAVSGNFTVADKFYFIDENIVKLMTYSGDSNVNVVIGDSTAMYVKANETISITYDNFTRNYIATADTMTKEEITAILNEAGTKTADDVTTYRGYNFKFGSNVLSTDFTELNQYHNDYQSNTTVLYSGTLEIGSDTFTIEKTAEETGITLVYDSARENVTGVSNFTEGESITINGIIYTVTEGKIIRASDGEYYNGDWTQFISNMDEDYYWGAITGWKITGSDAIYTVEDTEAVTVSGLNLTGAEVVAGELEGLSVDNNIVHIEENLIGEEEITYSGEGYLLQAAKDSATSILGSANADYIHTDNLSVENIEEFGIYARGGNDSISINRISFEEGNFYASGGAGTDLINVENVSMTGGTMEISGDEEADTITVSNSSGVNIISGSGNDTLIFAGSVQASISDFSAEDTIALLTPADAAQFRNGILTLGNVSLTLENVEDIYSFDNVKVINGTEETTLGELLASGFEWIVESGTATYGNLITVEGLSADATAADIALAGNVVTISNNALDTANTVTISDGYTLALDTDVTISEITAAEWKFENAVASYIAAGRTEGFSIVDNQISYLPASSETTLATLQGLSANAAADDLIVEDSTITISENALDSSSTVALTGDYTLKLAENVEVPTATATDWAIENGTANYNAAGMTGGFVISDNQISYQAPSETVTLITVTGLSSDAVPADLAVNDTTVTVSANALSQNTVVVSEGYTLALAEDVSTPVSYSTSWTVTRGTATYKAAHKTAGYVLSNNSIVYENETDGATLATITGLSQAATVADISSSGTNVTISANALSVDDVEISDGYTLHLASDVSTPVATANQWRVNEGVATYHAPGLSEGYVILNNIIVYQAETIGETLITVSGLSSDTTLADINLNDTTVTISADALTEETVTISKDYNLALASDVKTPTETEKAWTVESGTAIYRAEGLTDGYTISDNQIIYQAETQGETLITVEGLSESATVSDIALSDTTVTITAAALTESDVTISRGYNLALADDVLTPEATETIWEIANGTATYTGAGSTEGYTLSNNRIIYHAAADGETLFTISGLSSDTTADDISVNGSVVTVAENALATGNTVTITSGYTLAVAEDVTTPETVSAGWTFDSGTAIYNTSGQTAGYIISNNKISYKNATFNPNLITIEGLSENATSADIALAAKKVTLHINALAQSPVTITKGYTLNLASDVPLSSVTTEGWYISGGVANYNTAGQTEGYVLSNNTITYNEKIAYETKVTVTGLKSSATAKGLSLNGNVVTISNGIVNRGAVTVSDGYALNLSKGTYTAGTSIVGGDGADTVTNNGTGLIISTGAGNDIVSLASGVSKNTIAGGAGDDTISAAKGKNIYNYANGDGNDVINGFTENDSLRITSGSINGWTTEGTDVIFTVGEGSVRLTDAAGKKITTLTGTSKKGVTQIYNDGFIYDEDKKLLTLNSTFSDTLSTYASTIVTIDGTAADSAYINGNAKANKITGGSGADSINGGTGADTLTGGDGADVFIYANGGGKDVITDYTTEDSISISGASIGSASIKSSDVVFKVGSGTVTVKNGKSKQITTTDSTGESSTNVYEKGATYNADKSAVTYTSSFKGTLSSGIVTADASGLNSAVKIIGNSGNNSIIGTAKADTLGGGTGTDTLTGGNGKDVFIYGGGNDLITDYAAGDKISLASSIRGFSVEDEDLIFETALGNLTVAGGAGQSVTTVFNRKTETSIYYEGLVYNEKQTAVTLDSEFEGAYSAANISSIVTIDGAAADSVSITGNAKANKIYGGAGDDTLFGGGNKNDTLTGGSGADVFVYASGGGKDVIADFTANDSIYISSGEISGISATSSDVTFKVGSGSLTVKKGAGVAMTVTDSSGGTSTQIYEKGKIYNEDKSAVTFTASYKGTLESGVITADASGLSSAVKIFGNSSDNSIFGGSKADSLGGGTGNDTLTGGDGKDTFIFERGNDYITDYAEGDKIRFSTSITSHSIDGSDVIFTTANGSITVADGAGKEISTVVNGKTTKQIYTASSASARTLDLLEDDNFLTDGAQLSAITESKFTVTDIQPENADTFAQDKNILVYSNEK